MEAEDGDALVRRWVASRFPEFADLPLTSVVSGATDNAVYRLGPELLVRVSRNADAAGRMAKELRWLPEIARRVSARGPDVVGVGPGFEYPWAVQRWIEGRDAPSGAPGDWPAAATSLARLVRELRAMETTGGPLPDASNSFRGVPLAALDEHVRWGAAVTAELGGRHGIAAGVDVARVLEIWDEARAAPPWTGPPTWLHGDLLPGDILLQGGELAAVIDFGCAGLGDPACDGMAAWTLFRGRARELFLAATAVDDATSARARGWAAYVGITAMPYHHRTNPSFCAFARRVLDELLVPV